MKGITASIIPLFIVPVFGMYIHLSQTGPAASYVKTFELNGRNVKVTHNVDEVFYGRYQGDKEGYLLLNRDGSGEYRYDVQFPAENCEAGIIQLEWGFLLDEDNQVVRFERDYGFSYPVILKCTGRTCFQGCRVKFMVDYILDKKEGKLEVSSSDDWEKSI